MNEDIDNDKDYQIMELKQRISYYEPYKQKYEDLKEDWKYIKSLLDKEFNERTRLKKENEQLRQFINKGRRLSVKELMDNTNENELLKKKIRGLEKENEQLLQENNFLKQIREAFQIDVKNSRQMLKGRDSDE